MKNSIWTFALTALMATSICGRVEAQVLTIDATPGYVKGRHFLFSIGLEGQDAYVSSSNGLSKHSIARLPANFLSDTTWASLFKSSPAIAQNNATWSNGSNKLIMISAMSTHQYTRYLHLYFEEDPHEESRSCMHLKINVGGQFLAELRRESSMMTDVCDGDTCIDVPSKACNSLRETVSRLSKSSVQEHRLLEKSP